MYGNGPRQSQWKLGVRTQLFLFYLVRFFIDTVTNVLPRFLNHQQWFGFAIARHKNLSFGE